MTTETGHDDSVPIPTESHDTETVEWSTPDFVEQSACAEICAYVFAV
jgi:hypothetical protein